MSPDNIPLAEALTPKERRKARRQALWRGKRVADPELRTTIVREFHGARRVLVPFGIVGFAASGALALILYLRLQATGFLILALICAIGVGFWVVAWFAATRAIRRNSPF